MTTISTEKITIDENGEVKNSEVIKKFKSQEPNYIKIYLQDISYFYEVPKGSTDLVYELFDYVTYNTHEMILNMSTKKRIAKKLETSVATVSNNLTKLVQKGIIKRVEKGIYTLNPYLFGKGDWKSVKELRTSNIELEVVYDKETGKRTLKGRLEKQQRFNFEDQKKAS